MAEVFIRPVPVQGSAIGLKMNPTCASVPALTANNVVVVQNGSSAAVDVVRIQDGMYRSQHLTSADNVGVPIRFMAGAAGSWVQRGIVWDTATVEIDSSLTINATCSMFRALPPPPAGVATGAVTGLDPASSRSSDAAASRAAATSDRTGCPRIAADDPTSTTRPSIPFLRPKYRPPRPASLALAFEHLNG